MVDEKTKKVGAVALAGIIGLGLGGFSGANIADDSTQVADLAQDLIDERAKTLACENQEPVIETVEVEVEKIVEIEVEKIVEVNSGSLRLVLDEIFDNNGNVEYLVEDLDDDELDQIVSRINFANDIKAISVEEIKRDGIDELDKEIIGLVTLDEDDIERFKIYDDDDEVELDDINYEDRDADVYIDARFEQDDVKYVATFKVIIKDGEVDRVRVDSVGLRV